MNRQRNLARRTLQLYRDIDPIIEKRAQFAGSTCKPGCTHCCKLLVLISLPEALAIAEHLLADPQVDMDAIVQRLRDACAPLHEPEFTNKSYFAADKECVFLSTDRRCSIYPVRPAACRLYYAGSAPEECASIGSGGKVVLVNMVNIELYVAKFTIETSSSAGVMDWYMPIQIMLRWAIIYLTTGRAAFEDQIKLAIGIEKPDFWNTVDDSTPYGRELQALSSAKLPRRSP